ncbi:MAG: hypothetical protein AAF517_21545 [Planctomycetota bacterium]
MSSNLEAAYAGNRYRQLFSRKLKTWSINQFGARGNANSREVGPTEIAMLRTLLESRVSPLYAEAFDLPCVSGLELIRHHGYGYESHAEEISKASSLRRPDRKSTTMLWKKLIADVRRGECGARASRGYRRPVDLCEERLVIPETARVAACVE